MQLGTILETMPQVRNGKLRGLAVTSGKRVAFAPDIPHRGRRWHTGIRRYKVVCIPRRG